MPQGLRSVQLARVGTWKASTGEATITVGDLENMVFSFKALGSKFGFRPHLKLGHTDAQKFFGQGRSGFPSLGEVRNLWRDGDFLYGDIDNVPEVLLDLIEKRRYTQLSIEMYPLYEYEGVKYQNVLAAVALLGAELPAVKGLKDLADALFQEEAKLFADASGKEEFTEMPAPAKTQAELEAENAALVARVEAAEKSAADTAKAAKDATDALAAMNTRLAAQEAAGRTATIAAAVDAAIAGGTLPPKSRDAAIALAEAIDPAKLTIKFGEGDKAVEHKGVAAFGEFLKSLPKAVDFKEHGTTSAKKEGDDAKSAAQTIDEMAHAAVKAGKAKNYGEAFSAVMADPANAELKQRYVAGE